MKKLYWKVTNKCNLDCEYCFYKVYSDLESIDECRNIGNIVETVKKISPTSIMISGGEPGVREDVFKVIMHVKGICSNISVFTNGTFIDKYLEDILKNGWENLKFQVSIGSEGITDGLKEKIKILVENEYKVYGYIIVDSDFLKKKKLLNESRDLFSELYFQPLTVPQDSELYVKTLNCCSDSIVSRCVKMMCEYSPQASDFYQYLEKYYTQKLCNSIINSDLRCRIGEKAYFMNPDLTFSQCLHCRRKNSESMPKTSYCFSDRCICLADLM